MYPRCANRWNVQGADLDHVYDNSTETNFSRLKKRTDDENILSWIAEIKHAITTTIADLSHEDMLPKLNRHGTLREMLTS